ncbi:MAG: hypothetical protein J5817_07910, partial [Treponema sp.]|nr:hypothetical protein [Treponema sp.]
LEGRCSNPAELKRRNANYYYTKSKFIQGGINTFFLDGIFTALPFYPLANPAVYCFAPPPFHPSLPLIA